MIVPNNLEISKMTVGTKEPGTCELFQRVSEVSSTQRKTRHIQFKPLIEPRKNHEITRMFLAKRSGDARELQVAIT